MDAKGFVFAGARGKPIDKLEAVMKTICTNIGVERATPHDLRRTFGTKVTGLKHGRDAMDRLLNHKRSQKGKETVTDVYDRFEYGLDDKRIVEAVTAHIMSLIDGDAANNVVPFAQIS
jgi:integrase